MGDWKELREEYLKEIAAERIKTQEEEQERIDHLASGQAAAGPREKGCLTLVCLPLLGLLLARMLLG